MLKAIGTRTLRGPVGEPLNTEIAVRYTDAAKDPRAGVAIVFTCDPPGAVLFNGRQYATVNTEDKDRKGVASVTGTIQRPGRFTIRAETAPNDEDHIVDFDIQSVDPVGVHQVGPDTMVTHPWGGQTTRQVPAWPIAAVVIALIVGGAFLWLFERGLIRASGSGGTTRIVERGGGSTVDATARAEAQAARAAVDAEAARLRQELDSGLAANSAHDRGYGRVYAYDTAVHTGKTTLRLALENARRIAEGRGDLTADGRSTICASDPEFRNHPACRE